MSVRRLVTISFMAAIQYVVFTSFSFVLYLEFITFTTVAFAMVFPRSDSFMASVIFAIINMFTMGVNPWSLMYLFVYPAYSLIVGSLAPLLKKRFWLLITVSGILSFATGQLLQIPFLLFSKHITIYYIIAGLRVSVPQGIIAAVVCFLLFKPVDVVLVKIKERMYYNEKTI